MKKDEKFFDSSIPKFLLVGVGNTLLTMLVEFMTEGLGYWPSTALGYIVGAVVSFFLNRSFTFRSDADVKTAALKFALSVGVCYLISHAVAQPLCGAVLGTMGFEGIWLERLTKLGGMAIYTVLNYLGQRFFAFREK